MKTIGIIGGLSPESTVSYYLNITRSYVEKFGNYSYPDIIIYSVNLEDYHAWRTDNRWDKIADHLVLITKKLKDAGADFCVIATNTMHKVFHEVQSRSGIPLIHILVPVIEEIKNNELKKVGLLGTKFTMSESFYKDELIASAILPIVPNSEQQEIIDQIIERELVQGILKDSSRKAYADIIDDLVKNGAEGIILGCTEIPLLITQKDCKVPVFDTAKLHSGEALKFALK
jgi:aspartate racemase